MSDAYDATPLTAGTQTVNFSGSAGYDALSLREMLVVERIFVGDPGNQSQAGVEYTCRDMQTGLQVFHCRCISRMSGLENGDDDVLHPSTKLLESANVPGAKPTNHDKLTPAVYTDGDRVLVGFIGGTRTRPVILGVLRHAEAAYGATKEQGERRLTLHQGTSLELNKLGEYTITHKSGATIKLHDNGDIQVTPASGGSVFVGDTSATENLVLGQAFKTFAEDLIDALLQATYPTGVGPSGPMLTPSSTTLTTLKASLNTLLSDMAFTQKTS